MAELQAVNQRKRDGISNCPIGPPDFRHVPLLQIIDDQIIEWMKRLRFIKNFGNGKRIDKTEETSRMLGSFIGIFQWSLYFLESDLQYFKTSCVNIFCNICFRQKRSLRQ
jgi:hypothetical protein